MHFLNNCLDSVNKTRDNDLVFTDEKAPTYIYDFFTLHRCEYNPPVFSLADK